MILYLLWCQNMQTSYMMSVATKEFSEEFFNKARAVLCTHKLHAFISFKWYKNMMKLFSFLQASVEPPVTILKEAFILSKLCVSVNAVYNRKWWLGYVLQKLKDT